MTANRFDSVWNALEDTSESAENMKLRSSLMIELSKYIECIGFQDDILNEVVLFQIAKAKNKDTATYTMEDVKRMQGGKSL